MLGTVGYDCSAMWTSIMLFAQDYINLTHKITSIFLIMMAITPLITPLIVGPYIEKFPQIFLITESIYLLTTIAIVITLVALIKIFKTNTDSPSD